MPIMFNTILKDAGLSPKNVRLIRHKDNRAKRGATPYELWRDSRQQFEQYQSVQNVSNRKKFASPFWAVFVVTMNDETLFAGIYSSDYLGLLEKDTMLPHSDMIHKKGAYDVYELKFSDILEDLVGKLIIDWGMGTRSWVQYADRQNKPILELRRSFQEPVFPGFMSFLQPLSKLDNMPNSWITTLQSSRGVYLLTCPRTKEQYVGSATGDNGFWGRWQDYLRDGHGGNVELKSRDPSDYQVSILEVAGTSATTDDILKMEGRWQSKLQSREMGLNRNISKRLKPDRPGP